MTRILQFLPPFISSPFIELAHKEFDQEHAGDNDFDHTYEDCKKLYAFLYCAATDIVPDLTCCADPDDAEPQAHKKKRQNECILPVDTTPYGDKTFGNTGVVQ